MAAAPEIKICFNGLFFWVQEDCNSAGAMQTPFSRNSLLTSVFLDAITQ